MLTIAVELALDNPIYEGCAFGGIADLRHEVGLQLDKVRNSLLERGNRSRMSELKVTSRASSLSTLSTSRTRGEAMRVKVRLKVGSPCSPLLP